MQQCITAKSQNACRRRNTSTSAVLRDVVCNMPAGCKICPFKETAVHGGEKKKLKLEYKNELV
jgi:hypothetical protein